MNVELGFLSFVNLCMTNASYHKKELLLSKFIPNFSKVMYHRLLPRLEWKMSPRPIMFL
jgi:hypothetical protein